MEALQERLRVQMKKAFWDLLEEKVRTDPPDYDWICKLYVELRDRLSSFTMEGGSIHKAIKEGFDTELFSQMLRNQAFEGAEMMSLVDTTFGFVAKLQAPVRDKLLKEKKKEILEYASSGGEFSVIVPMFLRGAHELMDLIEKDLRALKKEGS